jgi:hypothetical protein
MRRKYRWKRARRGSRFKYVPIVWQGARAALYPTPEEIADAAEGFVREDIWGREVLAEAEGKRSGNV